jgi:hypothetical protein
VPEDLVSFSGAKLVVIGKKDKELTYDLCLSISQHALRHDDYVASLPDQPLTISKDVLTEIDVSSIFPLGLVPGKDYVGLYFRSKHLGNVQILGLRFMYQGVAGPEGPPGPQGEPGVCTCPISIEAFDELVARVEALESGQVCQDSDGDLFADISCGGSDCDDTRDTVYPGAPEICDGLDNNCNQETDEDACDASAQIQTARDATDGVANIPIHGAFVTYVRTENVGEAAGFFIQAASSGPALFIAADPPPGSPTPRVGDQVSFTILEMGTSFSLRQATSISDISILSAANDLAGLIQNVTSSSGPVDNPDDYESELIALEGAIANSFSFAGTGYVQAMLNTLAISGNSNFQLRIPQTLKDSLGLGPGCTITLNGTPMWRYDDIANPSAWVPDDITVAFCP